MKISNQLSTAFQIQQRAFQRSFKPFLLSTYARHAKTPKWLTVTYHTFLYSPSAQNSVFIHNLIYMIIPSFYELL